MSEPMSMGTVTITTPAYAIVDDVPPLLIQALDSSENWPLYTSNWEPPEGPLTVGQHRTRFEVTPEYDKPYERLVWGVWAGMTVRCKLRTGSTEVDVRVFTHDQGRPHPLYPNSVFRDGDDPSQPPTPR